MTDKDPTGTIPQKEKRNYFDMSWLKGAREDDSSMSKGEDALYMSALRTTMSVVPIVAVLTTVAVYISLTSYGALEQDGLYAVCAGPLVAIFAWLVVALPALRCITPRGADSRNYHLIREKVDRLKTRTEQLCDDFESQEESQNGAKQNGNRHTATASVDITTCKIVCKQVRQACKEIERGLGSRGGMSWVTGMGYMELWRRIHRAEEALIKVQPESEVLGGAMRDESRLVDSNMTNKKELLERLSRAVDVVDDTEACGKLAYVKKLEDTEKSKECAPSPRERKKIREKAITILSEVRYQINYFRDNVSEGIVLARNRLVGTSIVVGVATYLLLALAIFASAPPNTIIAASAYFLVGALAGLFARSQSEWTADTAVGDFGLSTSRLYHVPWLSGLAAIGGVLVIAVVDRQFMSHILGDAKIQEIFQDYSPPLLIVAAVFGLTPDLIIRRLTQQAESYKGDLQSTETSRSTKSTQKTLDRERT